MYLRKVFLCYFIVAVVSTSVLIVSFDGLYINRLFRRVSGPLHMSPVDRAGSVTGMNFALGSYEKFQPGFRDEKRSKILGTSSGAKFRKQSKHSETQKF